MLVLELSFRDIITLIKQLPQKRMNNKLFKEIIESELGFFQADGYSLREVDRNIWFEKKIESEGFRISFSYTEYGDAFHVNGLKASKRFEEVEGILQKVLGGELSNYYTITLNPDETIIPLQLLYTKTENNFHFEIDTVTDLHLFLRFVESFYEYAALPFYQLYDSLFKVYETTKELKGDQLSRFVNSSSNLIFSRLFIIKSFYDRPKAEEYYSEISSELTKMRGNNTMESILSILNAVKSEIEA